MSRKSKRPRPAIPVPDAPAGREPREVSIAQLVTPGITPEQASEAYFYQTGHYICPSDMQGHLERAIGAQPLDRYEADVVGDFERSSLRKGQPFTQLYKLIAKVA